MEVSPLSTNMATPMSSILLTILGISLISGTLAGDDDVSSLQKIFRLRFIFDEDTGESLGNGETSVILIEKTSSRDPIELRGDQTSLYGSDAYNSAQFKLPDSTLTFCFIVVIFYMVYLSLRMFIKPDAETLDPETVDTHVLHQLLLSHQFSEAVIPDKLRSLYDDGDQSGVTDLSKVTLIIDPASAGVIGEDPEKVPLDDEDCVCVFFAQDLEDDDDEAPPPYPGMVGVLTETDTEETAQPDEHCQYLNHAAIA